MAEEGLEFDFDDFLITVLFWLQTHLHVVAFVNDSDDVESTVPVSQVKLIFGRILARKFYDLCAKQLALGIKVRNASFLLLADES